VQERPPFRLVRTHRFRRAYRKPDARYRELARRHWPSSWHTPTYPGLRIKRIQGTDGIWAVRAGRDIRITFEFGEDKEGTRAVVLRNVSHHDPTLSNP
jgi:mRNA interferase RelE/StbE